MNSHGEKVKKVFLRFIKDNGVYSFMKREIRKEYGSLNLFIEKHHYIPKGFFDMPHVLSFKWETSGNGDEDENVKFWRAVNDRWRLICNEELVINII